MRNQTIRHQKDKQNPWHKKPSGPETDNLSKDIR